MFRATLVAAVLSSLTAGCIERTLTIRSNPPGALVYLNDQEIGRTPVTRDFTWYGDYDVQLRKDGYQTLDTHHWIVAPIYEWVPLDLISELTPIPFKDHQHMDFVLTPAPLPSTNPAPLIARGLAARDSLESSPNTRHPATRTATTRPH